MADGDSSDFTFCKVGVVVVCVSAFMFAVLLLCTITLLISFFPAPKSFLLKAQLRTLWGS